MWLHNELHVVQADCAAGVGLLWHFWTSLFLTLERKYADACCLFGCTKRSGALTDRFLLLSYCSNNVSHLTMYKLEEFSFHNNLCLCMQDTTRSWPTAAPTQPSGWWSLHPETPPSDCGTSEIHPSTLSTSSRDTLSKSVSLTHKHTHCSTLYQ